MAKKKTNSGPRKNWTGERAPPAARRSKRRRWGVVRTLKPPPKMTLSAWADEHFYLSAESAAEPGRWKTLPYQKGILDAITDPNVRRVSVMKSARVGYTKCLNAAIAYFIAQDPCPILVVQPTVEDAEGYSKEEIAPMLRDVKALDGLVTDQSVKTSAQTILHKSFPGGVLSMVGANSGRGFRRVSRRVVIFDEVDGYPPSAGAEGDQIKLGEKRSEYYWNRKLVAGSTPLIAGSSRIEDMFESGDRRRFYVPCPHCGHMDFLRFSMRDDDAELEGGHMMKWPKGEPDAAYFMCGKCGCVIEEEHKRTMLAAGEWRAAGEFNGHASFHIWAAYSLSPNATWGQIAVEFLEAKKDPDKLKTFVNTALGQTWKEKGDAPDWERLYLRRESYSIRTVPLGVIVLTVGVDVQKDRFVYEVVGWGPNKESWSVDSGEIYGDTNNEATWQKLDDELLSRTYPNAEGSELPIAMMGIDSSYNTQVVYNWCRKHPLSRVIAIKGDSNARMLIGAPSKVDVTTNGRKMRRGYRVWPVGVDIAKAELYGWLGLRVGDDGIIPAGYCHFPQYGEEFFKQLTAEHLVTIVNRKTNRKRMQWQVLPNRENHWLDCRVYARAAAQLLGLDRMTADQKPRAATPQPEPTTAPGTVGLPQALEPKPITPGTQHPPGKSREGFWNRPRGGRGGGWFGRRR